VSQETTYYNDGKVTITNARAVIGGKTYAMANITSVSATEKPPKRLLAGVFIVLGALLALAGLMDFISSGMDSGAGALVIGALGAGLGLLAWRASKTMYQVTVGSASGETHALTSQDQDYVRKVVDAMNQAIVERG